MLLVRGHLTDEPIIGAASHATLRAPRASTNSVVEGGPNGKVLAVTRNLESGDTLALFRCEVDGSGCTYRDISAGQGAGSGSNPSAIIDTTRGKLLVVTTNAATSNRPALFRCDVDGANCTYSDISAGQGGGSGLSVSAVLDGANGKLLVVTLTGASKPALFSVQL